MSLARPPARRLRREVITPRSWPIRVSSCLAGSTDTTSLMTYTYSTSPRQRTSPKSQVSASTHNDKRYFSPSPQTKTKSYSSHALLHLTLFFSTFWALGTSLGRMSQLLLFCGSCPNEGAGATVHTYLYPRLDIPQVFVNSGAPFPAKAPSTCIGTVRVIMNSLPQD
jgi:hypothetical protein